MDTKIRDAEKVFLSGFKRDFFLCVCFFCSKSTIGFHKKNYTCVFVSFENKHQYNPIPNAPLEEIKSHRRGYQPAVLSFNNALKNLENKTCYYLGEGVAFGGTVP